MQQLLSVWFAIDGRRRAIVALSAIAMFVAVIGLSRLATAPNLSLLYSGLEPGTAGEVVQALEQSGVAFDIRGDSIFVDATMRDQMRMQLASDGLPASNGQGYEILDTLTGFGTTSQMFDAAYWRAKEGELARTIAASPQFRTARVHISNTASRPFRQAASPSASVTVSTAAGRVSAAHAKALKFLVASAVAGMTPADVSIIDGRLGVVVADDSDGTGLTSGTDRETVLKQNIERLLEARVGRGNAVVEVFMDISSESEAITERRFDPDSRVAISSEKLERTTNSVNSRGGSVTVASNLPDGDAAGSENNSSSQDSETTERVNYEVSQTTRELLRAPGAIRRLSIAVLVDGVMETDPTTNTQTWTQRSDAEMTALRDLVASASGYDEARGDTLTLKSLQFQALETEVEPVAVPLMQRLNIDVMRIIQLAVLALVSLVLGLFVLRPILSANVVPALAVNAPVPGLPGPVASPGLAGASELPPPAFQPLPAPAAVALTGEIADPASLPIGMTTIASAPAPVRASGGGGQPASPSDPVERLRTMIADRQDETVDILQTWIDGTEERA